MISRRSYYKRLSILSVSAAILYNSWPLGHWLNPIVSKVSLASGLEAFGQPYNWLFIGGDILSSIIIVIVCLLIWWRIGAAKIHKYTQIALVSIMLFGLGTTIDALLPERCVQGIQQCPSFTQDHLLLFHGIYSILASVFLFFSLVLLWLHERRNVFMISLMIGYVAFGLISLIQAITPSQNGNWSQDYYISLCSVWLALIPYAIYKLSTERTALAESDRTGWLFNPLTNYIAKLLKGLD